MDYLDDMDKLINHSHFARLEVSFKVTSCWCFYVRMEVFFSF